MNRDKIPSIYKRRDRKEKLTEKIRISRISGEFQDVYFSEKVLDRAQGYPYNNGVCVKTHLFLRTRKTDIDSNHILTGGE